MLSFILLVFFLTTPDPVAFGHAGPPYPILVNQQFSGGTLSIWADPDVGTGTFFLYWEDKKELSDKKTQFELTAVSLIEPKLETRASFLALESAESPLVAEMPFAHEGPWQLSLHVETDGMQSQAHKIEVDVTPPGPAPWEFALYLMPFLGIGGIWFKLLYKRARYRAGKRTGGVGN